MEILQEIAVAKRAEVERLKVHLPLESILQKLTDDDRLSFRDALAGQGCINIIAEIKKGSPSKGIISPDFNPALQAASYRDGGAVAISVLTESDHFFGRYEYLALARKESSLPVLCKDFIIDRYQIYHAKLMKADAILLITRLLKPNLLIEFIALATEIGLDCLVEVHSTVELKTALDCGAMIIGVNNRNLADFSVDLALSEKLADKIPESVIKVTESGILSHGDIVRLQESGYNNFLIGELLMKSSDPKNLLKTLRGE